MFVERLVFMLGMLCAVSAGVVMRRFLIGVQAVDFWTHLTAAAGILVRECGARVPRDMEGLLALPGVGRKTANLVRNLGYGLDGICVDTHVHRISNRMGWVATKDPAGTEMALMDVLPRRYWIPINELLVRWGQVVCTPLSPHCSTCAVRRWCRRVGVGRSR